MNNLSIVQKKVLSNNATILFIKRNIASLLNKNITLIASSNLNDFIVV